MYYAISRFTPGRFFCLLFIFSSLYLFDLPQASARIGDGVCQIIQRVQRRPVEFNKKTRQGTWILGNSLEARYSAFFNPAGISIYEEIRPNQGLTLPTTTIQQFIQAQQEAATGLDSFKHYFPGEVFNYAGQKMVLEKNMEAYLAPQEGILILVQTGENSYAIAMSREWVQYRQSLRTKQQAQKPTAF